MEGTSPNSFLTAYSENNHCDTSDVDQCCPSGKNVIRIMTTDSNKLKFVLTNNNTAPQPAAGPSATETNSTPSSTAEPTHHGPRRPGKRRTAEPDDPAAKAPIPRSVKKGKYERKGIRAMNHDAGILSWAGLRYQPNELALQATFSQQFEGTSPVVIQALVNAYTFNENLGLARSRVRKEYTGQMLRKALGRTQFAPTQAFQSVSYRPGTAFVHYQNCVGKPSSPRPRAAPILEATKRVEVAVPVEKTQVSAAQSAGSNGSAPTDAVPAAEDQFICEGCKRTDAKKYAKNLCQTCYKKRKKATDGRCEDTPTKGGADRTEENVGAVPAGSPGSSRSEQREISVGKGWTGTCILCKR